MKYRISEGANILGKFPSGATVTVSLYAISDGSVVPLSSNTCTEIATTGVFKWHTVGITTQPTVSIEYLWVMTDGVSSQYGKLVLVVDEVWSAPSTTNYGTETMGEAIKGMSSESSTASEISNAVWDASLSSLTTAGSIGNRLRETKITG